MRTTTATAKTATTSVPLHPLLASRWSPRGLDPGHRLERSQLVALLEAARWAPSAGNTQPWRFAVAERDTAAFDAVFATLAPGNQAWAHAASALVAVVAETTAPDGTPRRYAAYDTGQAVAHLSVQAEHEGVAVHQLGGFDAGRLAGVLALPEGLTPLVVLTLGRRDDAARLTEPFASRETAARGRLALEDLVLAVPGTESAERRAA